MAFLAIVMILSVLAFIVFLNVLIGTWVHRDAKSKGLDPVKWTLIALLVPNLIGLIIYLVYRSDKKPVASCNNCHGAIDINASFCPYCGYQAPPVREMHISRRRKKSTPLILAMACAFTLAFFSLIGLIVVSDYTYSRSYSYYEEYPIPASIAEQYEVSVEYVQPNTVYESSSEKGYSFQFDAFTGEKGTVLRKDSEEQLYCSLNTNNGSGEVIVTVDGEQLKPSSWNASSSQDSCYAEYYYDLSGIKNNTEIEIRYIVNGYNSYDANGYLAANLIQ